MDIHIVSGATQELNNRHIFGLLKKRDKTKNHIIIAPDRSQFSIEQRLFEETGEKCFFDINVISVSRLAKKTISKTSKRILTKQSGVALVKKIITEQRDSLVAFNKASSFVGFANLLFETICFFKSCNVSPEEISVNDSIDFSNLKQKDIKLIYTEYEKYLQEEYTDSFNQLKVFADTIQKDTFSNTIFYFIEFDDYTRLMYEIIAKLAKFSDGFYIACTYGKQNNNANIFSNKVYYDLVDLFKFEGLNYSIDKVQGYAEVYKQMLAENMLAYSPHQIDLTQSGISIKCFNNIRDEVRFAVAQIYSSVLKGGQSFSNYTLVVPSLSAYKSILQEELNKYNINYYFDESENLSQHCLIRLMFDICGILSGGYRGYDFCNIIKSPLLNFDYDAVCEYSTFITKSGAIADMCLNASKISNEDLLAFVQLVKIWKDNAKQCESLGDCIELVSNIFEYIITRIEEYCKNLDTLQNRIFAQVINKMSSINEDMLEVFARDSITFEEFVDLYKVYFETTNISLPPIKSNTLFIADFETSYIHQNDYIFVLGNNESILPKQKLDNGLISDEELYKMPNSKRLTPTIAMLNARKVQKLYELILKYRKCLEVYYLLSSSDGKLYPNNIVNSLTNIYSFDVRNYSKELDLLNNSSGVVNNDLVVFNNQTPNTLKDNLVKYISAWYTYNSKTYYREIVSSLYKVADDNFRQLIENRKHFGVCKNLMCPDSLMGNKTSVSQIETFNMCPYMHFVRYGLRLKEYQDDRLKPSAIGSIMHEVLSKVIPQVAQESNESLKEMARRMLDNVLQEDDYKDLVNNPINAFAIKALYKEMDRVVVAVANEIRVSNFKPKYFEYKFDNVLNIAGVDIKGFVDRIDVKDDGFVIIDYKTGDNQFKNYNDVYSGKKLQLLVYANAIEKKLKLKPKGVFYLPISNGFGDGGNYRLSGVMDKSDSNIANMDRGLLDSGYKSNVVNLKTTAQGKIYQNTFYKHFCLNEEDFRYVLHYSMSQVEKSILKIRSGTISPMPLVDRDKSACDYCQYKALCNYQENNENKVENIESIDMLKEKEESNGEL